MSQKATLDDLVAIMAKLRSPGGCPWDRKQTVQTIKDYLVEECAEAYEAARVEDWDGLAEELGDVLFEVVFLSRLADEQGKFDITLPLSLVRDKLIRRHPHVFGDDTVRDADEVLRNWHAIKAQEKKDKKIEVSELSGVPRSLPPLLQAFRLTGRAAALGFDWNATADVLAKIGEEVEELRQAVETKTDPQHVEEEFGDVLFSLVNLGRFIDVQPHDALQRANDKFRRRFLAVEAAVHESGKDFRGFSLHQLDAFWNAAKAAEAGSGGPKAGPDTTPETQGNKNRT